MSSVLRLSVQLGKASLMNPLPYYLSQNLIIYVITNAILILVTYIVLGKINTIGFFDFSKFKIFFLSTTPHISALC